MTWNTYNRRKEILHEVLAIADAHRGESVASLLSALDRPTEITAEDLLCDAQMIWTQQLNGQIDRSAFLGDSSLKDSTIGAWQSAALDRPTLRHLLDDQADADELQPAFAAEHRRLARAAGISPDHAALADLGKQIKDEAVATMVYPEQIPDSPASLVTRIRAALAA